MEAAQESIDTNGGCQGLKQGEVWNQCFISIAFQFSQKKKVLEIDGGDGYTL